MQSPLPDRHRAPTFILRILLILLILIMNRIMNRQRTQAIITAATRAAAAHAATHAATSAATGRTYGQALWLSGIGQTTGSAVTLGHILTATPIIPTGTEVTRLTPAATQVTPIILIPVVTQPMAADRGRALGSEAFSTRQRRRHRFYTNTNRRGELRTHTWLRRRPHMNLRHRRDRQPTMSRRDRLRVYRAAISTLATLSSDTWDRCSIMGARS